jgi:hypothetical protein
LAKLGSEHPALAIATVGVAAAVGVGALEAAGLAALRAEYVLKVGALAETARKLLSDGEGEESVARTVHAARRAIGEEYKALTPMLERGVIYARNLLKYGDHLGPSVDYLRAQGKSWSDIIQSASRTFGGK